MAVRVDIKEEPGLAELLEAGESAPPEEVLNEKLDEFLATPGVSGTPVHDALDTELRLSADRTTEKFGLWDAFVRWWNGEEHRVVGTEDVSIELAAYWLTLPDVVEATVSATSSQTHSGEVSASIKIAGIGGGPTLTVEVRDEINFVATATEREALSAKATFEKVEVWRGDQHVTTYPRLKRVDSANLDWRGSPGTPPDTASLGASDESRRFDMAASSAVTTQTMSVKEGTTLELDAGLSLKQIGLEASLGTKTTYEREVVYAYTLPGGHVYEARLYKTFPAWLWTVQG